MQHVVVVCCDKRRYCTPFTPFRSKYKIARLRCARRDRAVVPPHNSSVCSLFPFSFLFFFCEAAGTTAYAVDLVVYLYLYLCTYVPFIYTCITLISIIKVHYWCDW